MEEPVETPMELISVSVHKEELDKCVNKVCEHFTFVFIPDSLLIPVL